MKLCVGCDGLVQLGQTLEVELVGVAFAVDFRHDVLVVVVSKRPAEFIVVHVWLVLAFSPSPRNFIGIDQLELAVVSFPCDAVAVVWV